MATRVLIPSTIIPPELYVQREADRQVRNVVNDMGRPGYVLVARQMGKTNLLLNAKRELETKNDAFVYVDLSAPFSSDRECFRHIIDTAIGSHENKFEHLKKDIENQRASTQSAAYKEHESELRALLASISGKLVIILDEIDSLTKGDFSDKVFAQIRSVYFSRINYPQFKRLTYLLSGVVEPNEIIKDKRISPFNIGEKIYLDDFSAAEFENFLSRANLQLKKDTSDRIFFWSNGNPRITWDICADLEDKLNGGYFDRSEEVDNTVQKLYLEDFNRAPVDHIREVVAEDDELRDALAVIRYNKGDTLPDATKSKLYLAGIVQSAKTSKQLKIKNRVIEFALSDQWLMDLVIKRKGILKVGEERFGERKYEEALRWYERFVSVDGYPEDKAEILHYHMGICAYHLGEYTKAITHFEESHWDKTGTAGAYYETKFFLGVSYLQLNEAQKSRNLFLEVLEYPNKDRFYATALLNIAGSYLIEGDASNAIVFSQRALTELKDLQLTKENYAKMMASAYYNLGTAFIKTGSQQDAIESYRNAVVACQIQQKPAAILALLDYVESNDEKRFLLKDCVDLIINNSLRPTSPHPERTLALTTAHFYVLLSESFERESLLFDRLLDYAGSLEELRPPGSDLRLSVAIYMANRRRIRLATSLAKKILIAPIDGKATDNSTTFQTYRLLSVLADGSDRKKYQRKYIDCLRSGFRPSKIYHLDLSILGDIVNSCIDSKEHKEAIEHLKLARSLLPIIHDPERGEFAYILYQEMTVYLSNGDRAKLRVVAKETLNFIESLPDPKANLQYLGKEGIEKIRGWAKSALEPDALLGRINTTVRVPKKIGRNERVTVRYKNGTLVKDIQFKKIQTAVEQGLCEIVGT